MTMADINSYCDAAGGAGESPFDEEFAHWLPGCIEEVHRVSLDGLRRPSGEAPPSQGAIHADELQSARARIAEQQRCNFAWSAPVFADLHMCWSILGAKVVG